MNIENNPLSFKDFFLLIFYTAILLLLEWPPNKETTTFSFYSALLIFLFFGQKLYYYLFILLNEIDGCVFISFLLKKLNPTVFKENSEILKISTLQIVKLIAICIITTGSIELGVVLNEKNLLTTPQNMSGLPLLPKLDYYL